MNKILFIFILTALLLLQNCRPNGLIKKKSVQTPSDSVLFYQQADVHDPFLDSLQTHPGDSARLATVLLPPPPPPAPPYKEVEGFRVQLFAGLDSTRALAQLSTARTLTGDSVYLDKKGKLFKVQVGDYLYRLSADSANRYFHVKGYKGAWVVKRKIRVPAHGNSDSTSLTLQPPAPHADVRPSAMGKITIQVLATRDETRALELVRQLQQTFSAPCYYKKGGNVYKIFVGKYKSRKEAEVVLKKVRQKGFPDAWLVY